MYVVTLHTKRELHTEEGLEDYCEYMKKFGWTTEQMKEMVRTGKVEVSHDDGDGPVHTQITLEKIWRKSDSSHPG